ncbi:diacylglycerol kinase [Massilia sp. Root133]|uniref:Diacylglycerol kinase n=1 Tax=Massilia cellulosiltytica TaxID=2683234 RepID=A0A7X3KAR4_9BURK|nr:MULTISPECIES: diacylglycerol kinase family protein [Telluria group]KQY00901.1 diacylglycerol kinase [Massilia sp. Root133]KQZ53071.1 diacylglycerol kinase [Massilia sp. Root1485]MVW63665.1 diacylglycerol kinase [Telluria cellulosilytica]
MLAASRPEPVRPDAPFYVVLNAGSGRTETDLRCTTIRDVLGAAGRSCELEVVHDAAKLEDAARVMAGRAARDGAILVAAGGDGTLNTVAHAAVAHGCVFGVLPQGTFNYFGRTHGIPEDLAEAVRALLQARVRPVQIGLLNERIFLVNASVGMYPHLLEEREHDKRQYGRSRVVALLSAIKTALRGYRSLRITLELDGQTRRLRTPTVFVGNNRLQMEQVGMHALDHALEEGRLVAIAPRPVGRLRMLGLLVRGALGRLGEAEDVQAFAFRSMTVRAPLLSARRKLKTATDGEVCRMRLPLRFEALEGRLLLLVPPEEAEEETAAGAAVAAR